MGRAPCCEKDSVKRGPWTPEEDAKLLACIGQHGTGSWRTLPKKAGLQRCGKSCRLRWTNYLRPDLKHGRFTDHEEQLIVSLHAALGSRWSLIAAQLPGRTDNDVKNYWNTRLKKKLCEMGIDPITHKPISQLLADLAGSMALPKGGEIAEAALGCFKDDMLNVLMRKRPDWQLEGSMAATNPTRNTGPSSRQSWSDLVATTSQLPCGTGSPKSVLSTAYESGSMSDQRCASDPSSARMTSDAVVQKIKYSLTKAVQSNIPGSAPAMHMMANGGSTPSSSQCNGSLLGDPTSSFVKSDQYSQHMAAAAMRSRFSGEANQNYNAAGHQFIPLGPGTGAPDHSQKSMLDMFMDTQGINARTSMTMLPNLGGSIGLNFQLQRDLSMHGTNAPQNLCKGLSNWEGNVSGSPPTGLGLHMPSSPLRSQHQSHPHHAAGYHHRTSFFGQAAPTQHPQQDQQMQQQELLISTLGKERTDDHELGPTSPPASPSESGCSPNQSQSMQLTDSGDLRNECQANGKNSTSPIQEDNKNPWSPSASGSSCSSTSLAAADAAIDGVLNSDVLLWDFSELSSIIN